MSLQFAVIHPGARLNYALPAALEKRGYLAHVYTDVCADIGGAAWLRRMWPAGLRPGAARRLFGRRLPPGLDKRKVSGIERAVAAAALRRAIGRPGEPVATQVCRAAVADGFAGADALLMLQYEDFMVEAAKTRGLFVAQEYYASPRLPDWETEERRLHRELATGARKAPPVDPESEARKFATCDLTIVPSRFVVEEAKALNLDVSRTRVIPYSLPASWLGVSSAPIRGRVLYVGSVTATKGVHYLAAAARAAARRNLRWDVRVVGSIDPALRGQAIFEGVRLVGAVPRSEIRREFESADVLVFPTLCDSFGMVQLEAMACGVPVITTPNAGDVVTHGHDGFVCPIRDSASLCDSIEAIVGDPERRDRMSKAARQTAERFTFDAYADALSRTIDEAAGDRASVSLARAAE